MKPSTLTEAPEAKTIRPLHDYLVVRPLTRPGMIGLLHIPELDSIDNKNGITAEVLAVGPGRLLPNGVRLPMEVNAGDHVHIAAYGSAAAGTKLVLNGEKVIMLRARDINGIVDRPTIAA